MKMHKSLAILGALLVMALVLQRKPILTLEKAERNGLAPEVERNEEGPRQPEDQFAGKTRRRCPGPASGVAGLRSTNYRSQLRAHALSRLRSSTSWWRTQ